jgi:hypothetical protein
MDVVFPEKEGVCTGDFCVYTDEQYLKLIINEKTEINLEVLKQMFRLIKRSDGLKPVVILLQPEMNLGREARDYIHKLNKRYRMPPVAVISTTFNETLIANFYKKFYKPVNPYRIFKRENEAFDWLKQISAQ